MPNTKQSLNPPNIQKNICAGKTKPQDSSRHCTSSMHSLLRPCLISTLCTAVSCAAAGPRVALVTSWTGRSAPAWLKAFNSRREEYAQRHGYALISNRRTLKTEKKRDKWILFKVVIDHFDQYDVIVLLDADVWINALDVPVTHFINNSGGDIFVEEWGGTRRQTPNNHGIYLQSGIIIFRTTVWAKQFASFMLHSNYCNSHFAGCPYAESDQCCMIELYARNKLNAQKHVDVMWEKTWNSQYGSPAELSVSLPLQCPMRLRMDCWALHVTSGERRRKGLSILKELNI